MLKSLDALEQGWERSLSGYTLQIGNVEVNFEPLLFDGQWYVAVYEDGQLVGTKVCVKLGKE